MKKPLFTLMGLIISMGMMAQNTIVSLTFDDDTSISEWQAVADATLPESEITWNANGVTTGAAEIIGSNTSDGIGRAYIYQYLNSSVNFGSATSVDVSFDIKLSQPLVGAAIHLQVELPGVGTVNTFDIQTAGINDADWTHLTFSYDNVTAGNLFRIQFNLAAGAFIGAGGGIMIDNVEVIGNGSGGDDIPGCMDATANNYSADATVDDGTCLYNVTFQVDMQNVTDPFTTPEVNGNFNGWCGNCAAMSDGDGNGVWEVTIELQAGTYEYKYAADNWNIQEALTEGAACTVNAAPFVNRSLTVGSQETLDVVCWGSCSACGATNPSYDITFQVDMQNVTDPFTTPEVNGTFNNWCGGCAAMTDDNADGIWTITITLEAGEYEYKYAADSWNIQEELTSGSTCTVTNNGFTNRYLSVTEDATLDVVCWAACTGCDVVVPTYDVTFQVDMQNVTETFTTPEVNGTFNNWCGNCAAMTDDNADNIWTITIPLQAGTYDFKYSADEWNIQEELTEGSSCTNTADGFTNRTITVTEDMTMDVVCWSTCEACIVDNVNEVLFQNLSIYPNPASNQIRIDGLVFNGSIPTIKIYDSVGRLVQQSTVTNVQSPVIDVTSLVNGIYMVELGVDGVQFTQKLMIQH
ncbi:MAG: T9SS type A sorting domain-containing protein [Flavobacteriales bacterium]